MGFFPQAEALNSMGLHAVWDWQAGLFLVDNLRSQVGRKMR